MLLVVLTATAACNQETKNEVSSDTVTDTTTAFTEPLSMDSMPALDAGNMSVTTSPVTDGPGMTAPAAQGQTAGLNPAHGEPGHRCEIAVGAPLNSPAGAAPAPTQVVTPPSGALSTPGGSPAPTITSSPAPVQAPAATVTPTAEGMNPPHGQPGHDCAIPVGSPLKK